ELAARRARPALRRARDFLRFFLAHGPRLARDVWDASRELVLSRNTLKRAAKLLRVRRQCVYLNKQRFDCWLLPGQELPKEGPSQTRHFDDWLERGHKLYPPKTPLEDD